MNNGLEGLNKFRNYLIKKCKHLNTGRSPVFISISLIAGISLAAGNVLLAPKTTAGQICFGIGSVTAVLNGAQLICKKYI